MSAMDFRETSPYSHLCLSILVLHAAVIIMLVFLCRLFGDLFIDALVAFHLLMDAVFLATVDKYLQVPSGKERTETSISKPIRNGALKPLCATPEMKPIISNSISTSLLRPKEKKVSPTQKKLRFSLNFEIGEPANRHFINDSTCSDVFSSEHADESDLYPLPSDDCNNDIQNPEYLPFADDEELEDLKVNNNSDILGDDDIDSISDEEDNPNSELHIEDIDDSEMGDNPRRIDSQREPSPTEDDYDEFLTLLRKDSMQHSVIS